MKLAISRRINDKEDEIEQQEQETELYKTKNDDLREKVCLFSYVYT